MAILVTGGLGYIGSHVCLELVNANYNVVVIDNLSNTNKDNFKNLLLLTDNRWSEAPMLQSSALNHLTIELGDLCNIGFLRTIFHHYNIKNVIHLAGYKAVNESVIDPIKYYTNNLSCLLNLINVMKENNCKNLIFSSSATVYSGNDTGIYKETSQTGCSKHAYGTTKYFQEVMLNDLYESDKTWNITILRYFNPAGNHPSGLLGEKLDGNPQNLFPVIANSIHNKTQIKIYGNTYETPDGTCLRDYIHVVDLARAHVCVLNCKQKNVYNVGLGKQISVLDIIKTYEEINNVKLDYVVCEKREGDVTCLCADPTNFITETIWTPIFSLKDMCKDNYIFSCKYYKNYGDKYCYE